MVARGSVGYDHENGNVLIGTNDRVSLGTAFFLAINRIAASAAEHL